MPTSTKSRTASCGIRVVASSLPSTSEAVAAAKVELGDDEGCEAARAMGEAIVGCDEMQAIKDALRHLSGCHSTPQIDVLRLLGVPDAAIEWVLS